VRPDDIVVPSPSFDDDLGLLESVEGLAIQQLAVEAFALAVLPGTTWFYVGGLGTHGCNPLPEHQDNKLRTIVRLIGPH